MSLAGGVVFLLLGLSLSVPGRAEGPSPEPPVPRRPSAAAQLEHALECKRALRGTRGEARRAARRVAVEAYRAVRRYFPGERELGAEAAFRAGELLRSAREADLAVVEFQYAYRVGRESEFGARGGLEIGHIERRRRRLNDALASYEAVEALGEEHAEERDLAAYWSGRVHAQLGRPRDARRCYERAARRGVDPVQRVRAFDAWAQSLVDGGDLEGAAGVIELCRGSVAAYAEEESELGLRVRAALERMRSVESVRREVERRRSEGGEGGEPRRCTDPPLNGRRCSSTPGGALRQPAAPLSSRRRSTGSPFPPARRASRCCDRRRSRRAPGNPGWPRSPAGGIRSTP